MVSQLPLARAVTHHRAVPRCLVASSVCKYACVPSSTLSTTLLTHFFSQAEDGIRDGHVTGVQTCALPISRDMKIDVTPEMIEGGIEAFAEQTGMSADNFRSRLKAQGVSDQALSDMARAEIGWLQEIGRASCRESVGGVGGGGGVEGE